MGFRMRIYYVLQGSDASMSKYQIVKLIIEYLALGYDIEETHQDSALSVLVDISTFSNQTFIYYFYPFFLLLDVYILVLIYQFYPSFSCQRRLNTTSIHPSPIRRLDTSSIHRYPTRRLYIGPSILLLLDLYIMVLSFPLQLNLIYTSSVIQPFFSC